jgi:4-hydroxythreonine-4-phosphate dehydrogenase
MQALNPKAPPVAITMGCPVGIGPEIVLRYFSDPIRHRVPAIVVGDLGALRAVARQLSIEANLQPWAPGQAITGEVVPVWPASALEAATLEWGKPDRTSSLAMTGYIEQAVDLIVQGHCSALVTCPIAKTGLKMAGLPFPGHTEMLAHLTKAPRFRMMMAGPRLRVVLVTIHRSLASVSGALTEGELFDCIRMTQQALQRDFGLERPRVAVAGLNPHAGEEGLFGDEEERLIRPALARAAQFGRVSGPWPPDTVFYKALAGGFDAVVAMYHDQGLIPFKLVHFEDGVNVTLGLPIVRTSVDHGTAYDIAGKGLASPASLTAAVDMAASIVANRNKAGQDNG